MWKYILIIAFLIFAIREINLMNESLYIAPDTHKIVSQDKTIIGKVEKVIEKKILKKMEKREKTAKGTATSSEQNRTQTETNVTENITPKTKASLPNLSIVEERNLSTSPKTTLPSSLEEVEKEIEKKTGKPVVLRKPAPMKEATEPKAAKAETSVQESSKSNMTTSAKKELARNVVAHTEQNITKKPKKEVQHYPDRYKNAQERVKAILEEMRKGKN